MVISAIVILLLDVSTKVSMAVDKRIVERHRGRIWVESELGKGSLFFFSTAKTGGS